jgi:hypothetical protein
MRKTLLLSMLIALSAPLTAHAFMSSDEVLSYTAMPLAVSNVCDVRGVQTDQVGSLVTYMNRANVSPDAFIGVFRYVPVALVLNSGRNPDFVQWVGSEVDQGVMGDELVTVMERRLTTYGSSVVTTRTFHHYRNRYPRAYRTVYETDYVPVTVQRYCEHELLDPFALIDTPLAVANVVDLGVPVARVGNLMVQLNLGYVAPVQTVEVLRYSPAALMAVDYGQPDFVQYVYDQRTSGLTGYELVRAVNRQLPVYGVSPQIDLAPPVYIGQNAYMPGTIQSYVAPFDPAFVPQAVMTRMASFAPARAIATPQTVAVSPQAQRLLEQRGNPVVVNPGQARREIAQTMRHGRHERVAVGAPPAQTFAPSVAALHGNGRVRHVQMNHGRGHVAGPPAMHVARPRPQAVHQHGRPQFVPQPVKINRGQGQPHGHGHGGGPPARVMAPPAGAPMPMPQVQQGHGHGNGHGNPNGNGHGPKKGKG